MAAGVYQISNTINGKRYIGSSVDLDRRQRDHFGKLRGNRHPNLHLQRAWNKHGEDKFAFEMIAYTHPALCIRLEQAALNMYKPEYNMRPTANSMLGYTHTKETKSKIGRAGIGRKCGPTSEASRGRLSKSLMGNTCAAKLSESDVYEIRRLYVTGRVGYRMLGKMFKISCTQTGRIIRYESWRYLQ